MKRLYMTAAFVLCAVFLAGCAAAKPVVKRPQVAQAHWEDTTAIRNDSVLLYFITMDNTRLTSETRDVVVQEGQTFAEAAVAELLNGPVDQSLNTVLSGAAVERVEVSRDVAYVDLAIAQGEQLGLDYESDTIKARAMIANTLCDLLNVNYVNVAVSGREPGYSNMPLGSMKRLSSDLSLYVEQLTRSIIDSSYPMSRVLTLYFPDITGSYLLCEAREVQLTDSNSVELVLNELLKGPRDTEHMQPVISGSARFTVEAPLPDMQTGQPLNAYERLIAAFESAPYVDEELARAAVVCSVMGFVPRIESLCVQFDGYNDIIGEDSYKLHSDFSQLIGTDVKLYYPGADRRTLVPVSRTIRQELAEDPATLVRELFKAAPESASSVFPEGCTDDMLLGAKLSMDLAAVNFSAKLLADCAEMDDRDVMLMVYSVVNTLTEITGIKRVQFLFDGVAAEGLGSTALFAPLLPNVGLTAR